MNARDYLAVNYLRCPASHASMTKDDLTAARCRSSVMWSESMLERKKMGAPIARDDVKKVLSTII